MWVLMTTRGQQLVIARLPVVLGNGPDADVRVPHESVIAQHARLSEGSVGTLRIEALGDGIVGIGGRRVERSLLRDGDELVLGRVKFTLRALTDRGGAPAAPTPPAAPAPSTARAPSAPRMAQTAPEAPALRAAPASLRPASLAAASPAEPALVQRKRTLQFSKVEARRGLLNADFSQLPTGQRVALVAGVLLLAGGLVAGVALLFRLFA